MDNKHGILILEDGSSYQGSLIGRFPDSDIQTRSGSLGEIVFNTSMSGYQEIITDPSYKGQILCFTYPSIGNYGINDSDNESDKPYLSGVVIHDYCERPSNHSSKESLDEYLKKHRIPGIHGVDTRCLVRHIRKKGELRAGIFPLEDPESTSKNIKTEGWFQQYLLNVQNSDTLAGSNLTQEFKGGYSRQYCSKIMKNRGIQDEHFKVAVLDFGIKLSILNEFFRSNILPDIFPGDTPYQNWENFQSEKYDGFFLSNGPGDPSSVTAGIENAKFLLGSGKPIFGICLGYQILSIALGGSTYKMKFGHHAANHPVTSMFSKRVKITSQNHGFAVSPDFVGKVISPESKDACFEKNLNDQTLEAFLFIRSLKENENRQQTIFGVQYHPEASPGPRDGVENIKKFADILRNSRTDGR